MTMNQTFKLITVLVAALLASGCSTLDGMKQGLDNWVDQRRQADLATVTDQNLIAAFYGFSAEGKEVLAPELKSDGFTLDNIRDWRVTFEKSMFSEANWGFMSRRIETYQYDSTNDGMARIYIKAVKGRGNRVLLYRPAFGKFVNDRLNQPYTVVPQSQAYHGLDNVLVEFSADGNLVSMLIRSHQATTTLGVLDIMYAQLLVGPTVSREIRNWIPNSVFLENYIRDL